MIHQQAISIERIAQTDLRKWKSNRVFMGGMALNALIRKLETLSNEGGV